MTEKDYVKEKLSLFKILMTGVVAGFFGALVYIVNSSTNLVAVIIMSVSLILLFYLGGKYKKLIGELKDMHEPYDVELVGSTAFEKRSELTTHAEAIKNNDFKEKDWNYYFTIILLSLTFYTVIKDTSVAITDSGVRIFIAELIATLFLTYFTIYIIKKQIK